MRIRLSGETNFLRWLNVGSCIATIICLTLRQYLKMKWFNQCLRREIFLGEHRASHSKFVMLEDKHDDNKPTVKFVSDILKMKEDERK